jgi:hypothetical protein
MKSVAQIILRGAFLLPLSFALLPGWSAGKGESGGFIQHEFILFCLRAAR